MNRKNKLALVKQLHKSKIEFSISLTSGGQVTVVLPWPQRHTFVFDGLDPSCNNERTTYFGFDWEGFSAAVSAEILARKTAREGSK